MVSPISNQLRSNSDPRVSNGFCRQAMGADWQSVVITLNMPLSYDPITKSLVLTVSTPQANQVIPVSASKDLMSLVIKYGSLRLVMTRSDPAESVTFEGVIPRAPADASRLNLSVRYEWFAVRPAQQIIRHGSNQRHSLLTAIGRIDAHQVNGALSQRPQPLMFGQTVSISPSPSV